MLCSLFAKSHDYVCVSAGAIFNPYANTLSIDRPSEGWSVLGAMGMSHDQERHDSQHLHTLRARCNHIQSNSIPPTHTYTRTTTEYRELTAVGVQKKSPTIPLSLTSNRHNGLQQTPVKNTKKLLKHTCFQTQSHMYTGVAGPFCFH